MKQKPRRRQERMVPLTGLAPPRGGPPGLYRLVRRARVAEILGPALGAYLLDVRVQQEGILLVFEGEEWEKALSVSLDQARPHLQALLGRTGAPIRIECRPVQTGPGQQFREPGNRTRGPAGQASRPGRSPASENDERETGAGVSDDPLERLRRLARTMLRRRNG